MVLSNPFYINYLISEDAQVTAIIVETEAAVTEDVSPRLMDFWMHLMRRYLKRPHPEKRHIIFRKKRIKEVVEAINRVVGVIARTIFP